MKGRLLVICDNKMTRETVDDRLSDRFPEIDIEYVQWSEPTSAAHHKKLIKRMEDHGASVVETPPAVAEAVSRFDPHVIATHILPIDADLIESATNLQMAATILGGTSKIDISAASRSGTLVIQTPSRSNVAVAEFTIGMILAEAKNIGRADQALKEGRWRGEYPSMPRKLRGSKLGIIGFGAIGRNVCEMATDGLGMDVSVFDPHVDEDRIHAHGGIPTNLDEVLAESEFVSIHAALTEDTKGLIDAAAIDRMRSDAFLINTARADIVEQRPLFEALRNRELAGAAFDVFWQEPIDRHSPFLDLDNVTLSPHQAGGYRSRYDAATDKFAETIEEFLAGNRIGGLVNAEELESERLAEIRRTISV